MTVKELRDRLYSKIIKNVAVDDSKETEEGLYSYNRIGIYFTDGTSLIISEMSQSGELEIQVIPMRG